MQITVVAQACCRNNKPVGADDPEKASVLQHLKDNRDSAWDTRDPYSRGETVMLSELREMGFTAVRVLFGIGNRRKLTYAL